MVSLDGFFEGPNADLSWHKVDEELNEYSISLLNSLDAMLFGRTIYELMAGYWPNHIAVTRGDAVVAERMNNLQKIVFSRTLKKVEWNNSVLINEVVPDEILKLKQQPGKDMSVGGSDLALTFIKHNLIDEYRILVCPVVLGKGKRLLEGLDTKLELQLVKTHTLSSGVTILYYHPK